MTMQVGNNQFSCKYYMNNADILLRHFKFWDQIFGTDEWTKLHLQVKDISKKKYQKGINWS